MKRKTGQDFRPDLSLVELPGIEPSSENHSELRNRLSRVRETTGKYEKRPTATREVLMASTEDPIRARTVHHGPGGSGYEQRRDQKYVVAVVLVPLSHVIVTVQFRNCGTAGTILRSYAELAGSAKLRFTLSVAYVHCDDTPLRSVM
jgi:hypothetical protein